MAAGLVEIETFIQGHNVDLMDLKNNSMWPLERRGTWKDRWLHNDIREVAYPYVNNLFDQLVKNGDMSE